MKIMMAALALAASAPAPAADAQAASQPVEVMVLGTYHFDNPGLDLNNVRADDVLKPKRQAELAALAQAIAAWKPTKIMVERIAKTPDLEDPVYAGFTPDMFGRQRDERVQIAYRLAHALKLRKVHAIDEQPAAGEPDYFPFGKVAAFAGANGMQPRLDALMAKGAALAKETEEKQAGNTIAELLIDFNDPARPASSIDIYYELLGIGNTEDQPGAELNAFWYMRNAKIFGKLMTAAEPGDRILVVYGSGHNYWLRHFAGSTPGFRNVDPLPYLRNAAGK